MTPAEWTGYLKVPFDSHAAYIAQLKRIAQKYPAEMSKNDHMGKESKTMLQI